eukprot:gene13532-13652_t
MSGTVVLHATGEIQAFADAKRARSKNDPRTHEVCFSDNR